MPYKITQNRICLNIPDTNKQSEIALQSKCSHLFRRILSLALRIFSCLRSHHFETSPDGRITFNKSFFNFETFNVQLDSKEIYINKKEYLKWRTANFSHAFESNSFSKDFLKIIASVKEPKNVVQINPNENTSTPPTETIVVPVTPPMARPVPTAPTRQPLPFLRNLVIDPASELRKSIDISKLPHGDSYRMSMLLSSSLHYIPLRAGGSKWRRNN